jgi:preprotein translocase subunit YajC
LQFVHYSVENSTQQGEFMRELFAGLALVTLFYTGFAQAQYPPRPGDTVWTNNGLEGTVNAYFPTGMVSVRIGYADYNYRQDQLATRGCLANLCSGQQVTTDRGLEGTVNGVFPDYRTLSVRIGYANYTYDYSQLASTIPGYPNGGLQVGQTVWTDRGLEGTVGGIFPDQRVSVRIGYANYTMNRMELAIEGCGYNLCSGDQVITTAGLRGAINGVFMDGQFSVRIGYANYRYPYSQLARSR